MSGALGGGNTSQLRNRKRVLSKNRTKAKLVPESKPDVEATRLVNDESRKIVIGYYLRSLWLTNSFVLFCMSFQICGLLGPEGVLSAENLLANVRVVVPGQTSLEQFLAYPSIFLLIGASDNVLLFTCIGGFFMSLFAAIFGGLAGKILSTAAAFVTLSIVVIGGDFCQFPWEFLLLEAHFIAVFLPTLKPVWRGFGAYSEPRDVALLATHFLLFRFMWAMGIEKLPFINNEKEWQQLTFLKRFYETEQPLPTAASWLLTKLPMFFHKASAIFTWIIEIIVPLLIFLSSKYQRLSAILQCILMVAIQLAGNYATFQVISVVLMLPLLTDTDIASAERIRAMTRIQDEDRQLEGTGEISSSKFVIINDLVCDLVLIMHGILGAFYLIRIFEPGGLAYLGNSNWMYLNRNVTVYNGSGSGSGLDLSELRGDHTIVPAFVVLVLRFLHPFRIVNQYGGIFHDTFDHEGHVALIFQGSDDGTRWHDYSLKYSIQREHSFPQFFAPYMPRLDHAAFYEGTRVPFYFIQPSNPFYHQGNSWMLNLVQMLLDGNKKAIQFFDRKGFEGDAHFAKPPKYVRVILRTFKFSSFSALFEDGKWFRETRLSMHLPPVQNCKAQESAGVDQYTISSCEENNCRSFMAYLGIDTTTSEDCNLPNLSDDALSRLWSLDEIGITLVNDIIPYSYRITLIEWLRQKYCGVASGIASRNLTLRDCLERAGALNLVPADIKTIAIITEQQIMIETFVGDAKHRFPDTKKVAIERLHVCLHNFYYFFLAGDTDQNGKLNYDESISVFTVANFRFPEVAAARLFEQYDVTVAQNGIDFGDILLREDFIAVHCGLE